MKVTTKVMRYCVVGAVAFGIDYGVTLLLVEFTPLLVANSIGFLVANVANFLMAHSWVFRHEWNLDKMVGIYLSVLLISVIGLILNNAVVFAMVGLAGLSLLFGKVVATATVMAWNFLARLLFVYKKKVSA